MPRKPKLNTKDLAEWQAQFKLAEDFHVSKIKPTAQIVQAYRRSAAHWPQTQLDDLGRVSSNGGWPYDAITANLIFAGFQGLEPRVLMRAPRIRVKPASRVTGRFARLGDGSPDNVLRHVLSAVVQQIVNWRVREFDFKDQLKRAHFDDYFRGYGAIRHGYKAETSRIVRNRQVETEYHQHIRPGWPFAVHQPVAEFRHDALARDPSAWQWVAFAKMWRMDDLEADSRFSVPKGRGPTHYAGLDRELDPTGDDNKFFDRYRDTLGRVQVWEVWDRRTNRIIHWVGEWETELGVEDWPDNFDSIDGLPVTLLMTNRSADGVEPISTPEMTWDLQLQLNKLLSMILIYAKRGVPLIGVNREALADDAEAEKIQDAEILEILLTRTNPKDAVALLNLQPNMVPVIQAIGVVRDLIREVGGQSPMFHGNRINVESAAEAIQVGEGQDVRVVARATAIQEAAVDMVRKDWQIFQRSVSEDQIVDIADLGEQPQLFKLTPAQIKDEYDFEMVVGSTQPANDDSIKRDILALIQASQGRQDLLNHFNPRAFARLLSVAFNFDETEVLVAQDAAFERDKANRLAALAAEGIGANGSAPAGGGDVGAAIDSFKPTAPGQAQSQ